MCEYGSVLERESVCARETVCVCVFVREREKKRNKSMPMTQWWQPNF